MNLTRERIRQVETRGLLKLREDLDEDRPAGSRLHRRGPTGPAPRRGGGPGGEGGAALRVDSLRGVVARRAPLSRGAHVRARPLSVSDKRGLVPFAQGLAGSASSSSPPAARSRRSQTAGVPATKVSEHTQSPEILGGRVKTLHPRIHGGILGRPDLARDRAEMEAHGIEPISLVGEPLPVPPDGGRRGRGRGHRADRHRRPGDGARLGEELPPRGVVVDPADYDAVLAELRRAGAVGEATRRRLMRKAFAHTAAYDAAIAGYLAERADEPSPPGAELARLPEGAGPALRREPAPARRVLPRARARRPSPPWRSRGCCRARSSRTTTSSTSTPRSAWCWSSPSGPARDHQAQHPLRRGARRLARRGLPRARAVRPGVRVRRHRRAQPRGGRGAARGRWPRPSSRRHRARLLRRGAAGAGGEEEPAPARGAGRRLTARPGRRPGAARRAPSPAACCCRTRTRASRRSTGRWSPSARPPRRGAALRFAWTVCKHVKSNAIVFAKAADRSGRRRADEPRGLGEDRRRRARRPALKGSAWRSDAFFPFRDGVDELAKAGAHRRHPARRLGAALPALAPESLSSNAARGTRVAAVRPLACRPRRAASACRSWRSPPSSPRRRGARPRPTAAPGASARPAVGAVGARRRLARRRARPARERARRRGGPPRGGPRRARRG